MSELSAPALVAALRALETSQLDAWRAASSAAAPNFMHEHQAERLTILYGRLHNRPPRSMDAEVAAMTRARGAMFAQHHSGLLGLEHGLDTVPGSALVVEITRRLGRRARLAISASTGRDPLAHLATAARRQRRPDPAGRAALHARRNRGLCPAGRGADDTQRSYDPLPVLASRRR